MTTRNIEFEYRTITSISKDRDSYAITLKGEVFTSGLFVPKEIKNFLKLKKGMTVLVAVFNSWTCGIITESGLSYFVPATLQLNRGKIK